MNLFAGAWEARDVSPLPVDVPLATDNQVSHSQVLHFKISALQLNQTFATFLLAHLQIRFKIASSW